MYLTFLKKNFQNNSIFRHSSSGTFVTECIEEFSDHQKSALHYYDETRLRCPTFFETRQANKKKRHPRKDVSFYLIR